MASVVKRKTHKPRTQGMGKTKRPNASAIRVEKTVGSFSLPALIQKSFPSGFLPLFVSGPKILGEQKDPGDLVIGIALFLMAMVIFQFTIGGRAIFGTMKEIEVSSGDGGKAVNEIETTLASIFTMLGMSISSRTNPNECFRQ